MAMTNVAEKKSLLAGMRVYLAGPIDDASDDGVRWRTELIALCDSYGIGLKYFNPTNKPKSLQCEIGLEKNIIKQYLVQEEWSKAQEFMKKIRHEDLTMVDKSDFLIAYVDKDSHMCGTYDEMFTAEDQSKPIFTIVKQGKKNIPAWLVSFLREEEVFNDVKDCVDYLYRISNGTIPMDKRWVNLT